MIAITHYPRRSTASRRSHGVILVAVLGFIFLIAVFVTQFLDIATRQIRMRAVEMGRTDLRTTAYSAMEVTLAVLAEYEEIDEGLNRPSQGWGNPLSYAALAWPEGVDVQVTVEDETGRIPLYPVPEEDMRALLEELEVDFSDADTMVDSLVDWQDEDDAHRLNGAEDSYYEREDPPYLPANAPLTRFSTLSKIQGFKEVMFDEEGVPNDLYYRFINAVSLHNSDQININTAPPDVLAAYAGQSSFDQTRFEDFMSGLDRILGTSDDEIIRNADDLAASGFSGESDAIGYSVALLRVRVSVRAGEKHFNLEALVETGGGESRRNGDGQGDKPERPEGDSGDNSSGNNQTSSFNLLRLVENANFD